VLPVGAGERAALVAEQLGLDQVLRDGTAIDCNEGAMRPRALTAAFLASRGRAFPLPGVPLRMALVAFILGVEWTTASWTGLDAVVRRLRPVPRYGLYLLVVYAAVFGTDDGSMQQFIYFQF